jgi:hypothetical protein
MNERKKLEKQINDLISFDFQNNGEQSNDMTPTMSDIYYWGKRNMPVKIMKAIIKRNKE